jgi:undecaprenyl diphosphate synthase
MKKEINHVAVIMDGNGRWAKEKFRPRVWGHIRGTNIVTSIVETASDMKLGALTLYAFSTENWSRPNTEVSILFKLLKKFLIKERQTIKKNNIQFRVIGHIGGLDKETQNLIKLLEDESAENSGLKLSFAFSYGGRTEIIDSVNSFIEDNPGVKITENDLENNLYRPDIGDVDLMIRTGGDKRISNYLLWQMSYAELFFTDTKWPDFTTMEFEKIIDQVSLRDRRFGSLDNDGSLAKTKNLKKTKNLVKDNK